MPHRRTHTKLQYPSLPLLGPSAIPQASKHPSCSSIVNDWGNLTHSTIPPPRVLASHGPFVYTQLNPIARATCHFTPGTPVTHHRILVRTSGQGTSREEGSKKLRDFNSRPSLHATSSRRCPSPSSPPHHSLPPHTCNGRFGAPARSV